MTPEDLKLWVDATLPVFDRLTLFLVVCAAAWLGWRVPWARFVAWLAEPTVGSLIFVCAFCLTAQSILSQESNYKYWNPYLLEYAKFLFGTFGNGFMALKAYRMVPENQPKDGDKTP